MGWLFGTVVIRTACYCEYINSMLYVPPLEKLLSMCWFNHLCGGSGSIRYICETVGLGVTVGVTTLTQKKHWHSWIQLGPGDVN